MDYRPTNQVPRGHGDLVFRESRLANALAFFVFLALTLTALAAVLFPERIPADYRPPRLLLFLVGGGFLLFLLVTLYTLRASLRPSNWLVRFDGRKLYIKFRSYLNAHFPEEDPVVAALDEDEVEWIRRAIEKRVVPGQRRGRQKAEYWTYLDLRVSTDTTELKERIREERQREAPMVRRSRTKAEHYPVGVPEAGLIRVEWKGPRTRIKPKIDRAIALLSRSGFALRPEVRLDEKDLDDLDREEAEARILKHVERGETVDAVKLARRAYGMSLTEAREFVDGLRGG